MGNIRGRLFCVGSLCLRRVAVVIIVLKGLNLNGRDGSWFVVCFVFFNNLYILRRVFLLTGASLFAPNSFSLCARRGICGSHIEKRIWVKTNLALV